MGRRLRVRIDYREYTRANRLSGFHGLGQAKEIAKQRILYKSTLLVRSAASGLYRNVQLADEEASISLPDHD
jgi:hypothetical protein